MKPKTPGTFVNIFSSFTTVQAELGVVQVPDVSQESQDGLSERHDALFRTKLPRRVQ